MKRDDRPNDDKHYKLDKYRPINYCKKNKSHYRDCKSKRRWSDYNEASKQAKKIGLRVYYCKYCDGYHLSSRALKNMNRPT